jgi:hypothetical protein
MNNQDKLNHLSDQAQKTKQNTIPEPSDLQISTMTVITNIKAIKDNKEYDCEIDISTLSRFVDVYPENSQNAEDKNGCVVGIDYFSNIPRGCSLQKSKKSPFYNQATIHYNYWGFRSVNVKIFNNGKLQMTGLRSKDEAELITSYIIKTLKDTTIKIYPSITALPENGSVNDFSLVYNPKTRKSNYYRWNYFKNFKDVMLILSDNKFNNQGWISDSSIKEFIDAIKALISNYENQLSIKIENHNNNIPTNENDEIMYQNIIDEFKNRVVFLKNKLKKIEKVRKIDAETLCNIVKNNYNDLITLDKDEIADFEIMDDSFQYKLSTIKIELINSDFNTNFPINNTKLHEILSKKYRIFASYEPNDYPGVKSKYCWSLANIGKIDRQGRCFCNPPCFSRGKKSVCTQITISIFQSGSIIITGAKSIQQIKDAYLFINTVLKGNYSYIKGRIDIDSKSNEKNTNEIRKIMRKKRLFYVKKVDIENNPFAVEIIS